MIDVLYPFRVLGTVFSRTRRDKSPDTTTSDPQPVEAAEPNLGLSNEIRVAKYEIGQVVRHKRFPFRGVIFDVDPIFSNTEEWYNAIPEEVRPHRDQPYYHLFAENEQTHYIAYVSEQNLEPDETLTPVSHPDIEEIFTVADDGRYQLRGTIAN